VNDHHTEQELIGAYVLDSLTPEEREAFAQHLESCAACLSEVQQLRQVVDVLPLAVEQVEPPASLRERIGAAIEAETPALQVVPATAQRRLQRFSMETKLLALAALIVIAALGVWNVRLQQQIQQRDTALAFQQRVAAAIAGGAGVSRLPGTGPAPGASAALVQPTNGKPAYLIVRGLPVTPSHKVYEVWLIHGTVPRSAGTFHAQGNAPQIVQLPMASTGYTLAAVTIEPGLMSQPTGPKVLVGKIG
jgi:anti-sigma-K factor RskA